MGILNLTPDSFYEGSRFLSLQQVLESGAKMAEEGATFLDLGGYSTRPGAGEISEQEEIDRLLPIIEPLSKFLPEVILSVDSFRSKVARKAVEAGAHIINDVSGGTLDKNMLNTVLDLQVPYILMHMRGTPQTMSQLTNYDNLVTDILRELLETINLLRSSGLPDIIIDPGFGFAKTMDQNFELMDSLGDFQATGCPILVGISRKGMIYKKLDIIPNDALNGTTALHMLALEGGASVLRVHDVLAASEAIKLWMATRVVF